MTVKLMVLYPPPADRDEFERRYVQYHLPLMRELVGPDTPILTYRTIGSPERPAPYCRVAEIHFDDMGEFDAFVQSGKSRTGRDSAIKLSTGGTPTFLVCERQDEVPPIPAR